MFDISDTTLKAIISILLCIPLVLGAVLIIRDCLIPTIQMVEAESGISAGIVTDKKIINARSGLFSSSDIDYRLVIEGNYEYKGEIVTGEKTFSVDKETYQQANVGDWFDSHTLEITKNN